MYEFVRELTDCLKTLHEISQCTVVHFDLCTPLENNSKDKLSKIISEYLTINLLQPYLPRNCYSLSSRFRFLLLKAAVDSIVLTTGLPPQTNALVICRRGCVEKREKDREHLIALCKHQQACTIFIDLIRVMLIRGLGSYGPQPGSSSPALPY